MSKPPPSLVHNCEELYFLVTILYISFVLPGLCSCSDCKEACSDSEAPSGDNTTTPQSVSGAASGETNVQNPQNTQNPQNAHAHTSSAENEPEEEPWTVDGLDGYVFVAIILFLILMLLFSAVVIYECKTGTSSGKKIGR